MQMRIRVTLFIGATLTLILAAGFFFQMPWAISIWPWPDGRLSYTFVASMQAAIAAAMLWIAFSGEIGAMAAGALNLSVMMAGLSISLLWAFIQGNQPSLLIYALGCFLFALFNIGLFVRIRQTPLQDTRLLPQPVRISFMIFILALVAVGTALVFQIPNVMPWPLKPDTSVVFGWMFLGDAFYFLYALIYPRWHNAKAPLWSFLAYDLVLIGPFLAYYPRVQPEWVTSLVVYIAILVYSGCLAIYYLFINKHTR